MNVFTSLHPTSSTFYWLRWVLSILAKCSSKVKTFLQHSKDLSCHFLQEMYVTASQCARWQAWSPQWLWGGRQPAPCIRKVPSLPPALAWPVMVVNNSSFLCVFVTPASWWGHPPQWWSMLYATNLPPWRPAPEQGTWPRGLQAQNPQSMLSTMILLKVDMFKKNTKPLVRNVLNWRWLRIVTTGRLMICNN